MAPRSSRSSRRRATRCATGARPSSTRPGERDASYFIGVNRNKQAIALDIGKPEGRAVLLRLLDGADVLIENFKPGAMEKWGLGYEQAFRRGFPA